MPKSLADGRMKVVVMTVAPADMKNVTAAELTAGFDASAAILSNGFNLGPEASDTVDEKSVADEGNVKVMTSSNYRGSLTAFRYFDETGKAETTADQLFQAMKVKGVPVWIAKRFTSKRSAEPMAAGDELQVFEVRPDNAQDAEATGYIKKVIPLQVESAELNAVVAGP